MASNISATDLVPGQSGYFTVMVPYDGQADINEDELMTVFSQCGQVANVIRSNKALFIRYHTADDCFNSYMAMKVDFGAKLAYDTLPEHLRPSKAGGDNLQSNPASSPFVDLRSDAVKTRSVGGSGRGRGFGMRASKSAIQPPPRFMPPRGPPGPPRIPFSLRGAPRHPPPFYHPGGFGPPPRGPWRGPSHSDMWRPPFSGGQRMPPQGLFDLKIFDFPHHTTIEDLFEVFKPYGAVNVFIDNTFDVSYPTSAVVLFTTEAGMNAAWAEVCCADSGEDSLSGRMQDLKLVVNNSPGSSSPQRKVQLNSASRSSSQTNQVTNIDVVSGLVHNPMVSPRNQSLGPRPSVPAVDTARGTPRPNVATIAASQHTPAASAPRSDVANASNQDLQSTYGNGNGPPPAAPRFASQDIRMQPAYGGQGQQTFQSSSLSQAEAVAPPQEWPQSESAAATNHQPQAAAQQPVRDRLASQPPPQSATQQASGPDQWHDQPRVSDIHMQQDYMAKIARECCSSRTMRASDLPRQFSAIVSYVPGNESSYCWIQPMHDPQIVKDFVQTIEYLNESLASEQRPVGKQTRRCVARFADAWCRAYIDEKLPNGQVKIFFIDYGNVEVVPLSHVFEVPDIVWSMVAFALPVHVRGFTSADQLKALEASGSIFLVTVSPSLHGHLLNIEQFEQQS